MSYHISGLLQDSYRRRLEALDDAEDADGKAKTQLDPALYAELAGKIRQTEREELYRLQSKGAIGDKAARKQDLLDLRFPSR